jgi:hypothetical protein
MSMDKRTGNGQVSAPSLWVPSDFRLVAAGAPPVPAAVEQVPAPRPRRERTPRPWDAWPANVRLAVGGTGGVMLACWTVSFDAIVAGAQAASIPFLFALLCPVIVDGEMAIGTLALVSIARTVKRRTRIYLGCLILASVAVSMAANMAGPYTRTHLLPAPWSYFAAGVPSLWIALIVHQLVILWRHVHRGAVDGVQPDASTSEPVISNYGVRSADGAWWWDGGRWCPVPQPAPAVTTDTGGGAPSAGTGTDTTERPPSGPKADTEQVAARVASIVAFLREQTAAGHDPAKVGVSAIKAATGIPRPSIYRLRASALSALSTQPAQEVAG